MGIFSIAYDVEAPMSTDEQIALGIDAFGREPVDLALAYAAAEYSLDSDTARVLVGCVLEGMATEYTTVVESVDEVLEAAQRTGRWNLDACEFVVDIAAVCGLDATL